MAVASNWHLPWVVSVGGEVMRPGLYVISEGERLSALLHECGGFRADAFPRGIVFTRATTKLLEQQQLNTATAQLSQSIAQFALISPLVAKGSTSTSGGASDSSAALAGLETMLGQFQNQQAVGRVVVHMSSSPKKALDVLTGSSDDLLVQDQDYIAVPKMPSSVNVLGEVYQPTSIIAQNALTVQDYLDRAGGYTPFSDKKHVMIIKADGAVVTSQGLSESHTFPFMSVVTGGLMDAALEPGDTVYVPQDIQSYINLQYAVDVSSIFANSAQALAVIALLGTKL